MNHILQSKKARRDNKGLMKLVLQQVQPYRLWILLIFLLMLVESAMSLATPWPLKIIIDNVIGNEPLPHWLSRFFSADSSRFTMAAIVSASLVVIAIVGALAGYFNSYLTESVAQYVANDVRLQVYHHLQRLSLSYYDTHQVGKILNTITADVATMQDFVSTSLLKIVIDAMTIAGILGIMFFLNWQFALIAIAVTPFLVAFVSRFKRAVKKSMHEVRVDQGNMLAVLQQGLEAMRVINAFGTQAIEEERLRKVSLETVHASLRTRKLKSLLSPVISILVSLCIALVLWQGTDLVLSGALTIGALTVFLSYLNKFFSPVKDLAKMTNNVAQATVALERIQVILETDNIISQKADAIQPGNLRGEIEFEDVSFAYNNSEYVLDHLNLHIRAGQRVGICGPTGSGKSTIASLIPRFYEASAGTILIDGSDIRNYVLEDLRNQIGFVLQDTVLFYGTLRDNIAYGKPGATEQDIIEAARLANAGEFIQHMEHGLDTVVGERGMTLSGGQRQRIGIARAILRNAPILILDEPTASLDTESEKLVMDALEKLMEGRTVIIIAHRLSTIYNADRIIVIKEGRVEEEGTHEALLKANKLYASLYHLQAMDNAFTSHSISD